MIWSCEVDDWFFDEDYGMNEGVLGDDERMSLWALDCVFLVFLRGWGRGNSNEGIPIFLPCDLVNLSEERNWEETLAWDNSYYSSDMEISCNLWIEDW